MKNISLTIILFASAFRLFDTQAIAQDVTSLNCPPTAAIPGQEEALRSITKEYLTALRAKDWNATSKLSVTFLTGFNLTQALMQDLLQPLKIESSSFEIHEASVKPCEATVSYTLNLKAEDPQTKKRAIDVIDLRRVTHWRRFECACPPNNVTQWMLVGDVADVRDLLSAVTAAKTPQEQRLLLLAKDNDELQELAAILAQRGYEFLEKSREAEASKMFSLNRAVIRQLRHHTSVRNQQQVSGLQRMLEEAVKNNDKTAQGSILNSLGEVYLGLGEQAKALKSFQDSLDFAGEDRKLAASAYKNIAVIYRNQGEFAGAVDYFLKSLGLYKALESGGRLADESLKEDFTEVHFNLAFLYEALEREDLAQKEYRELSSTVEKDSDSEALMLVLIGSVKTVKGNVAEATAYLERASSILARSRSEDKATYSVLASSLLVEPYLRRNDYAHAAAHLVRAREALKGAKVGEVADGFILMVESMLYGSQGDRQLAASRTQRGVSTITNEILKKTDEEGVASVNQSDDRDGAILPNVLAVHAVNSLLGGVLADTGGDEVFRVPNVLNAVALKHAVRGGKEDLEAARKLFFRVLDEADGDELLIAQTHERIAGVYRREKNYREALDHYYKSLSLIERARLPLTLRLTEYEPTFIGVWRNIARLHAASGDYEQALESYRKILARDVKFYRLLDTTLLYEIAEINFKLGKYEGTLSSISQALSAAAGGGDRDVLWKLHTLAGKAQRMLKRDEAAARSFSEAIKEVEASRSGVVGGSRIRERFFEDKLGPYHEMIAMLVEQGKCGEALAYAERVKSRVLLDTLNNGNMGSPLMLTERDRGRDRELRSRMIAADRELAAAQAAPTNNPLMLQLRGKRLEARLEYEAFRIGLRLSRAGSNAFPSAPTERIGPAEIVTLLPPAAGAVLEFAVTDNKTYLFVLTEGTGMTDGRRGAASPACTVHSINVGAKELKERVTVLNGRIANSQGVVQPLARGLYDLLLKPAQAALTGKTVLLVVPDRYLWTLPFQALQRNDGRYLLQESAIYYAPSLTSLREMRKTEAVDTARPKHVTGVPIRSRARSSSDNTTLLVIANPAGDLSPLLLTESRASKIAELYGTGRSKVYVGADATEARFKNEARGFNVIHLGAHGIFDDDDPMYSRVLLSRDSQRTGRAVFTPASTRAAEGAEDGLLEAWEIMDLDLNAKLVVLSACETARGRVSDGEGIVGLTWALFMAGVPSTVVSQWKVDEGATSELMYLFHQNLVKTTRMDSARARKAEALRQASLKLLDSKDYGHPYYWAGFVLIGDGN